MGAGADRPSLLRDRVPQSQEHPRALLHAQGRDQRRNGPLSPRKLKVGAAWRIQINVTAKASRGTIRDKAKITSATPDPRTSNDTATAHTKVTK